MDVKFASFYYKSDISVLFLQKMKRIIIKNGKLVNEGHEFMADLMIENGRIAKIDRDISHPNAEYIEVNDLVVMPGIIDDQVHFREPGLTHKASIFTESRAAAAGGVTSFMEMPNTNPQTTSREILADKYILGAEHSAVNYSFYMGGTNDNLEEVLAVDYNHVCGIKVFMGSSTGNMLVDDPHVLENLFRTAPVLIATHCEDEKTIKENQSRANALFGESMDAQYHPVIRSREACFKSSSFAVELAKKYNTRLHVLHISTEDEIKLFANHIALKDKRITAEVCVHHLFFNNDDYQTLGNLIKCNPAIKQEHDQLALAKALSDGLFDVVATDHAPHTQEEKMQSYTKAPAGLPLVQHPLQLMLTMAEKNNWSLAFIIEKMCHNPAIIFQVKERGFLREGYYADVVIVDPDKKQQVIKEDLLYKCGWSPLEGRTLQGQIMKTFVNGDLVWNGNKIIEGVRGKRLEFVR